MRASVWNRCPGPRPELHRPRSSRWSGRCRRCTLPTPFAFRLAGMAAQRANSGFPGSTGQTMRPLKCTTTSKGAPQALQTKVPGLPGRGFLWKLSELNPDMIHHSTSDSIVAGKTAAKGSRLVNPSFSPGGVTMAPDVFLQRVLASEERSGHYVRGSMCALIGKKTSQSTPSALCSRAPSKQDPLRY